MHTPLPLFSIVIPVYNQQLAFLKQAVESAVSQTYPNIEIIISDNYSTNEVTIYLETLNVPHLRIVKPPEFLPLVQHFQFAADQAEGDYLSFLCSDDWIYSNSVETLANELLAHPQAVMAYGEVENVDYKDINKVRLYANCKKTGMRSAAESLDEVLSSLSSAWIPGGFMKRSAYNQIRSLLNGEISYGFDDALLYKLHEFGDVIYINKPVAKFRIWSENEGKIGGNRLLAFVNDSIKIKSVIKSSYILQSYLSNSNSYNIWLRNRSEHWLLFLSVGLINSRITYHDYKTGVDRIKNELNPLSIKSNIIYLLLKSPLIYITKPLGLIIFKVFVYLQFKFNKILH